MKDKETKTLILSVFIAGICSIVYELLIATASSYFLGDSIKQFSITIGAYMAAMGAGSYLSRAIPDNNLLLIFIRFELLLGLIGGLSVPLLYAAFAYTDYFQASSITLTLLIGLLIGLEIPCLSRLLEQHYSLKVNLSTVLSVDYLGALIATLIFPFILLPAFGTFKTSLFFGLINMTIAVILLWCFAGSLSISKKKILWLHTGAVTLLLGGTFLFANTLLFEWSNNLYTDRIIYAKETPYQHIVLTEQKDDLRLYLNGNLQFSSSDEYRYHEALVHVPININSPPKQVLFLGGGDGLGVREALKYPEVTEITLVDLDPAVCRLGQKNPELLKINKGSLNNNHVTIINDDAYQYLLQTNKRFDLIVIDLPDPNNPSLARLYSKEFYKLIRLHLSRQGIFVTQATSPFFARKAFWTIVATIQAAGFSHVLPYHVNVPSFGEWGFVAGSDHRMKTSPFSIDIDTKYLDTNAFMSMVNFPRDIGGLTMKPSTIDKPSVLDNYLQGWDYWH